MDIQLRDLKYFEAVADAWIGGSLSLAPPGVQEWMIRTMLDFVNATGAGGFAWDHNIFAGDAAQRKPARQRRWQLRDWWVRGCGGRHRRGGRERQRRARGVVARRARHMI